MSAGIIDADEPSKLAEQSLRVVWLVDSTVFGYCRCACCGGLRHAEPKLAAPRAEPVRPGS
jgi:hypothetical protein